MNTESQKDQTQDQSTEQPASASAGSEGDAAADTTKASTTRQEATEEEKTVKKTSPSPPSDNTGTADKQPSGFVFGSSSGNVKEESNVGDSSSISFSPGTTSTPKSSGHSSSRDTPNVSTKNRKSGGLRFANRNPRGFQFSNVSVRFGPETPHASPFSSGTGGNASSPNSTPLPPAPLQQTPGSSNPPLGQTEAGGGQSTEQAGGGQSREQAGGSQSTEQAGGGQSTEQAGGGQSTEQARVSQSAESFAPTPAHITTAVAKEGAGTSVTAEGQGYPNMSRNPAESWVDSGIEQSRDDVDDASSNAQTSPQKETKTGDDRRSLDPTSSSSSFSVDRKSKPHHGPTADRPTSPGATSKNSGGGASSQDPKDSSKSSSPRDSQDGGGQGEAEALRSEVKKKEDQIWALTDTITRQSHQLADKEELEMSYQDVKRQLEESERIRRELEASLEDAGAKLAEAQAQSAEREANLQEELERSQQETRKTLEDSERISAELRAAQEELAVARRRLEEQGTQSHEELRSQIQDLQEKLQESERIHRELKSKLDDVSDQLQQTERDRDNHERDALRLELCKRDLTEKLDRLKNELQEKSSQIPHLTEDRDDARNERDRLAKELEDERLHVEQQRNIASTLQNHLALAQRERDEKEAQRQVLEGQKTTAHGTTSTPKSSGHSSSSDTPNVSTKNRKSGGLRFANRNPRGFQFSNVSVRFGPETPHASPFSSGTGGNASSPNSTPLPPAPLQQTPGSSPPPLGQTEAGGGQSTEQAGGGQSTEQAGGRGQSGTALGPRDPHDRDGQGEAEALRSEVKKKEDQIWALTETITRLSQQLADKGEAEALRSEVKKKEDQIWALTETTTRLSQQLADKGEAEALRSEVKKKEDQIWALTETITRQSQQLADKEELERSYQDVKRQLEESERIRRELEASLEDAGAKLAEAQAQFEEREANLQEELERSQQETRKTLEDSERISADLRVLFRVLMRSEKVLKVGCNHLISTSIKLKPMASYQSIWCWVASDYAHNYPRVEQFAVRFQKIETAKEFNAIFEHCQQKLRQSGLS